MGACTGGLPSGGGAAPCTGRQQYVSHERCSRSSRPISRPQAPRPSPGLPNSLRCPLFSVAFQCKGWRDVTLDEIKFLDMEFLTLRTKWGIPSGDKLSQNTSVNLSVDTGQLCVTGFIVHACLTASSDTDGSCTADPPLLHVPKQAITC